MWTSQAEKVRDIRRAMDANPDQSFVLFGDSSHRDPEVYAEILALYPTRVLAVFIHKVNNVNPARVTGMNLITNYAQVASRLLELNILDEPAARRAMEAAQAEGLAITDSEIDGLLAP
jgi:phosphatidate phosphatase APP1